MRRKYQKKMRGKESLKKKWKSSIKSYKLKLEYKILLIIVLEIRNG